MFALLPMPRWYTSVLSERAYPAHLKITLPQQRIEYLFAPIQWGTVNSSLKYIGYLARFFNQFRANPSSFQNWPCDVPSCFIERRRIAAFMRGVVHRAPILAFPLFHVGISPLCTSRRGISRTCTGYSCNRGWKLVHRGVIPTRDFEFARRGAPCTTRAQDLQG